MRHVISRGYTELDKFEIEHLGITSIGAHRTTPTDVKIFFFDIGGGLWRNTPVIIGEFIDDDHTRLIGHVPYEDMTVVFTLEEGCDLATVSLFDARQQMQDDLLDIDWLDD